MRIGLIGGKYDEGHYFGDFSIPIEGTGEHKKVGAVKIGKMKCDVVDWTGKEKQVEYWECDGCFDKASRLCWLEELMEKLYGERCKDYDSGCPCCQAWGVYAAILDETRKKPK